MQKQQSHNPVLHLMGESAPLRVRAFSAAWADICTHALSQHSSGRSVPLSAQLGLERERLMEWSLEEYGAEVRLLLRTFEAGARAGAQDGDMTRRLQHSVGRLLYALEQTQTEPAWAAEVRGEGEFVRRLREELYRLLLLNIQRRRVLQESMQAEGGPGMSDWPEQLKAVAAAGLQLFEGGPVKQQLRVARQVGLLLDEMHAICAPQQRAAVEHMMAEAASGRGVIEINRQRPADALPHFERQLALARQLARAAGEHVLVTPLMQTANTLAWLGRYSEALPMFERALHIAESALGPHHTRYCT
jgi:tetratricopeptide (TPR) repeat protein